MSTANDTTVLVVTIAREQDADQIARETGLSHDEVHSTLKRLKRRGVVRNLGGGYWLAEQRQCTRCSQRPSGGAAVYVDPETFRWFCENCWQGEVEELQELFDG